MARVTDDDLRHFQIGAIGVSLSTTLRVLRDEYTSLYRPFQVDVAAANAVRVSVRPKPFAPLRRRRYEVSVNDRVQFEPTRADEYLPYVEWSLNWEIPHVYSHYLQVHASSLEIEGQGVILPGESGSGKSTLTAGLLTRGWRYLCDEFALIHSDTLALHPYPRAICVKRPSHSVIESLGIQLHGKKPYLKGSKGYVRFINPLEIRPDAIGAECPIRYVIFPKYAPGATPTLVPISRAEAAFALHRVCFNLFGCDRLGLDVLATMIRGASCYRLTSGDLGRTCDLLQRLVGDGLRLSGGQAKRTFAPPRTSEISHLTGSNGGALRPAVNGTPPLPAASTATAFRTARQLQLLERMGVRFNESGIPLLVLKGGALHLTEPRPPTERPMDDIDLLVRPEHVERACALLEELGGLRAVPQVREDFFPRFHYEVEYRIDRVCPVKIDLHVRPFRPLRYGKTIPQEALWDRARLIAHGRATLLIPSPEEMLIHLTVHAAIHGYGRPKWLHDCKRWADAHQSQIDWDVFLLSVANWRLAHPVRQAVRVIEHRHGAVCPPAVTQRLSRMAVTWRDRLALWHAPRDAASPVGHVVVNSLCTPGWRFVLSYLLAVALPDKRHMAEWYGRRHWGWVPCAHVARLASPLLSRIPLLWRRFTPTSTRRSAIHGVGVFANRAFPPETVIARYQGKPVEADGAYVTRQVDEKGVLRRFELTGKLRFLNHSCRANAEFSGFELIARRHIPAGQEITIDYGPTACACSRHKHEQHRGGGSLLTADVA